ncbi:MAG TPA: AbrB/MazE/SpoVT family DNA-binding domain-containing protein [Candidatus Lokiarchaeia archaeon]|nr:AbrB/MazE/SpoVT family DNA-binding domain-containing protein [Candidatus Lokiarchaeia archaeon]
MIPSGEAIVGNRGEILAKKKLRQLLGIQPGDKLFIETSDKKMIIRKIPTIDEIFDRPPIASGTPDEIEKELEEEGARQEEMSNE